MSSIYKKRPITERSELTAGNLAETHSRAETHKHAETHNHASLRNQHKTKNPPQRAEGF
jgi:hypothetical protein